MIFDTEQKNAKSYVNLILFFRLLPNKFLQHQQLQNYYYILLFPNHFFKLIQRYLIIMIFKIIILNVVTISKKNPCKQLPTGTLFI